MAIMTNQLTETQRRDFTQRRQLHKPIFANNVSSNPKEGPSLIKNSSLDQEEGRYLH